MMLAAAYIAETWSSVLS